MWLCKGSYVTSDSEIQHPSPLRRQGKGGIHLPDTGFDEWGSDDTDRAVEGLRGQRLVRQRLVRWATEGQLERWERKDNGNKWEKRGEVGV